MKKKTLKKLIRTQQDIQRDLASLCRLAGVKNAASISCVDASSLKGLDCIGYLTSLQTENRRQIREISKRISSLSRANPWQTAEPKSQRTREKLKPELNLYTPVPSRPSITQKYLTKQ